MSDPPGPAGYRLPAEFEPHEATWMAWPHDERTWVAGLEAAEEAFGTMIEALSHGERVDVIVRPADVERARERLATRSTGDVVLHERDHADAWLRDTGPTVLVRDGERLALDWRFDAWGGKYEDLERDDALAAYVAREAGIPRRRVDRVCEGGALEANGRGTVLTTRDCLVEARGHGSRAAVERLLAREVGAEHVIWLEGSLAGDDTDGHVDQLARFAGPRTVLAAAQPDEADPDHAPLAANRATLRAARDADGRELEVLELPQPDPVEVAGARRPASYANFYVANDVVLTPTYGDPNDDVARARLAAAFPKRRVVDVPARPLVAGYGACHCLTQQVPAV